MEPHRAAAPPRASTGICLFFLLDAREMARMVTEARRDCDTTTHTLVVTRPPASACVTCPAVQCKSTHGAQRSAYKPHSAAAARRARRFGKQVRASTYCSGGT